MYKYFDYIANNMSGGAVNEYQRMTTKYHTRIKRWLRAKNEYSRPRDVTEIVKSIATLGENNQLIQSKYIKPLLKHEEDSPYIKESDEEQREVSDVIKELEKEQHAPENLSRFSPFSPIVLISGYPIRGDSSITIDGKIRYKYSKITADEYKRLSTMYPVIDPRPDNPIPEELLKNIEIAPLNLDIFNNPPAIQAKSAKEAYAPEPIQEMEPIQEAEPIEIKRKKIDEPYLSKKTEVYKRYDEPKEQKDVTAELFKLIRSQYSKGCNVVVNISQEPGQPRYVANVSDTNEPREQVREIQRSSASEPKAPSFNAPPFPILKPPPNIPEATAAPSGEWKGRQPKEDKQQIKEGAQKPTGPVMFEVTAAQLKNALKKMKKVEPPEKKEIKQRDVGEMSDGATGQGMRKKKKHKYSIYRK